MTNDMVFRIAWMYYQEGKTQQVIARQLGISRFKVMDYLARAKAEGIVQVTLNGSPFNCLSLEQELKERLGMEDAVVIPTPAEKQALKPMLGQACAQHLSQLLEPGMLLGTAWGTTVYEVGEHIQAQPDKKISVITLLGGLTYNELSVILNPFDVAIKIADKLGGYCHFILAPAIVDSSAIRRTLLTDKRIIHSLEMAASVDIALVGLGATSGDAAMLKMGFVKQETLDDLKAKGAVGDILGRYFDSQGKQVSSNLDERVIGLSLEQLSRVNKVVAVAGGEEKVLPIIGALKGRYINGLVTDEETAQAVLKKL